MHVRALERQVCQWRVCIPEPVRSGQRRCRGADGLLATVAGNLSLLLLAAIHRQRAAVMSAVKCAVFTRHFAGLIPKR